MSVCPCGKQTESDLPFQNSLLHLEKCSKENMEE